MTYSNTLFSHFWQIYFWTSKAGIMVLYKAIRTCYSFMGSFFHDHKKCQIHGNWKDFFFLSLQKVSYKSPSPCTSCALYAMLSCLYVYAAMVGLQTNTPFKPDEFQRVLHPLKFFGLKGICRRTPREHRWNTDELLSKIYPPSTPTR